MANALAIGLGGPSLDAFQRWLQQWRATHGTDPPRYLIEEFLSAQMTSAANEAAKGRQLALQERGLNANIRFQREALDRQAKSAEMGGYLGLGMLGVGAYPVLKDLFVGGTAPANATETPSTVNRFIDSIGGIFGGTDSTPSYGNYDIPGTMPDFYNW